jgi:hypothetical protein
VGKRPTSERQQAHEYGARYHMHMMLTSKSTLA